MELHLGVCFELLPESPNLVEDKDHHKIRDTFPVLLHMEGNGYENNLGEDHMVLDILLVPHKAHRVEHSLEDLGGPF